MSEENTFKPTQIGIFNPGRLSDREIERAFITRIKLFEYLLKGIVSETPGTIPQHYLVIGQRGMGKSTLLHRLAVELRKEPHRKNFLPLTFPEEQYNVDRLSKFWLNCLDALADALDREGSTDQLDQLDQDISRWASTARDSSATQLYEHFAQWVQRTERRPVLLVDNLGLIFDRLSREEQHQLRAILMDKDAPILVGASANTLADTVDYGAPFYDAFQTQYLKKLTFEETMEVLENLARMTDNSAFANTLRGNRPRLRTLYQLTGGTPRTIVMLYPLIRGGFSLEVQTDLEGLMDVMTPLYKARFEELPEQMQVILDAVALHWDPIALDDLRQITQLENPQLSPQLKRLYEVGWLDRLSAYEKKGQAYEISERFFNIWYLMRRSSRRQKKELLCLTKFLVTLYGEELNQMGERVIQQGATHRDHVSMQLAIADGVKDHELARKLREKSYNELFELSRTDASILKDFDIPGEVMGKREADLLRKLQEAYSTQNLSEALAICEDVIRVNPKNAIAWYGLGMLYKNYLKSYVESEIAYYKAIELDSTFASPWDALGNLYQFRLEKYEDAKSAYHMAIQLNGTNADPWNGLGNLYQYHLGRYEEAEAAYRRAIELDEADADPWLGLGNLYQYHLGRYEEAKSAYHMAIQLNGTEASPWNNLGLLYQHFLGRYAEAEAAYRRAIELDSTFASPWHGLGSLYQYHLRRYEEAEAAYRRAIELDRVAVIPWNGLGNLYQHNLGRFGEAEAAYRRAIELDEADPYSWYSLGYLYQHHLGRYEEAEAAYQRAIELDEADPYLWYSLGNLFQYHLGRYEEAEAAYQCAIKLDEKSAYPWYGLGNLYQDHLGRYEHAEAAYRRAIELDRGAAIPWNGLGNLYQHHLERYGEAEVAYRRAIELNETDANPWNGLGNLYQDHLYNYDEAEMAYIRSNELDLDDESSRINLLFLYRDKMHLFDKAKMLFNAMDEPKNGKDSYWLNASLFALYDKNLGIAEKHLLQALHYTEGKLPPNTQDDWWRFAAVSINLGYGQAILEILQQNGYDVILRPYFVAIQSLMAKDSTAFLNSIAAEVREVAADLAERIKRFM